MRLQQGKLFHNVAGSTLKCSLITSCQHSNLNSWCVILKMMDSVLTILGLSHYKMFQQIVI